MRTNELGIPMIDESLRDQLFGEKTEAGFYSVYEAIEELEQFGYGKLEPQAGEAVNLDLPPLQGKDIEEHWRKIGQDIGGRYLYLAQQLADVPESRMPKMPNKWLLEPGWVRYAPDEEPEPVDYPCEPAAIFDVETLVKVTNFPVMACALSEEAWYLWCSPRLFRGSDHLVPLGDSKRLIVAHNACFDIARVEESYKHELNGTRYLDTLSMHTAVAGLSSKQRPYYLSLKKNPKQPKPPWFHKTSGGSLKDLVEHYTGEIMSKTERNIFVTGTVEDVIENFQSLAKYNALDCFLLWKVFRVLLPIFLQKNPHPVTFAGMLEMSREYLPTNLNSWQGYIRNAERVFHQKKKQVQDNLLKLVDSAIAQWKEDPESVINDPWLQHLDWSLPSSKARKLKNYPEWYRSLHKNGKIHITASMQIAPLLLRISWMGFPLYHHKSKKWGYLVPAGVQHTAKFKPLYLSEEFDQVKTLKEATYKFYKIPHKDGDDANVGNPLGKDYLSYFENGTMSSELPEAKQAIENEIACSYWVSVQDRVHNQFIVGMENGEAIIIPQLLPMGTITRRAVENTWLTASNAKEHKVGSEIKSTIRVDTDKYAIVGADVASQEAWLSALYGDSIFKGIQGCTAYSMQILAGDKKKKTDFHNNTAKIVNRAMEQVVGEASDITIKRDDAKIFNYSRIYMAGVLSTTMFLKQVAKSLSDNQAKAVVEELFRQTKGVKKRIKNPDTGKTFYGWIGGTESHTFNYLEDLANANDPRTPVLGSGMSEAIHPKNLVKEGEYLTSRGNWGVQSSGVDFLHCLISGTYWLCRKYDINARLMLTIHDEYRWVVAKEDRDRLALAMQIAHLWTRTLVVYRLGFRDLPEGVAWFEEIDYDFCLRKESNQPCVTPSQPEGLPLGRAVVIRELIEKGVTLDKSKTPALV